MTATCDVKERQAGAAVASRCYSTATHYFVLGENTYDAFTGPLEWIFNVCADHAKDAEAACLNVRPLP